MPTVYVATSSPGPESSVGMMEWRNTMDEAIACAIRFRSIAAEGDEVQANPVDVPADIYAEGSEAISEYLAQTLDY